MAARAGEARRAVIGLGGSLGDRRAILSLGLRMLAATPGLEVLRVSRAYLSPPAAPPARGAFWNAAALIAWRGTADQLLSRCMQVEARCGRRRGRAMSDRTLDLDVLWIEGLVRDDARLAVPHPRMEGRDFALVPLLEVAPDARHPGTGRPLREGLGRGWLPAIGCLATVAPTVYRIPPQPPLPLKSPSVPMKFFIDTAKIDEIRQAAAWGIVDGVTTNPSLIRKAGGDFVETIAQICEIIDGPISAEVVAEGADDMVAQGRLLARIHDNVVVKVPLTREGIAATSRLSAEGIRTNVTLCFSANQALLAAKAGATYISPFIGRIDDVGGDGVGLIEDIAEVYANYPELDTQILAASIRHPQHVFAVARAGSDVATIPFDVLDKLFNHPLTDIGNKKFNDAWASAGDSDIIAQVSSWLERNGR